MHVCVCVCALMQRLVLTVLWFYALEWATVVQFGEIAHKRIARIKECIIIIINRWF